MADLSDTSSLHYVLVGLCVHEGTWFALDKRLNGLKSAYCQHDEDFELHAAQFACTIKEQDEIPGFAQMTWSDRRARSPLFVKQGSPQNQPSPQGKRGVRDTGAPSLSRTSLARNGPAYSRTPLTSSGA